MSELEELINKLRTESVRLTRLYAEADARVDEAINQRGQVEGLRDATSNAVDALTDLLAMLKPKGGAS